MAREDAVHGGSLKAATSSACRLAALPSSVWARERGGDPTLCQGGCLAVHSLRLARAGLTPCHQRVWGLAAHGEQSCLWSQFPEGRLAPGLINGSRLLSWLASQFTDLLLSVVGGVMNDPAAPARQAGQALRWLPLGLLQVGRLVFLLCDLGGAGVSSSCSRKAGCLHEEGVCWALCPVLCHPTPHPSQGTGWTLVELCHLQGGPRCGTFIFLWGFMNWALSVPVNLTPDPVLQCQWE